jgi:hypothetical protein
MTAAQRYWLTGFLLVVAIVLSAHYLEWARYDRNNNSEERLVIPVFTTLRPHVVQVDEPAVQLKRGDEIQLFVQHGIYVRYSRNASHGIFFGALLPLLLIGAAGFVALGKKRHAP